MLRYVHLWVIKYRLKLSFMVVTFRLSQLSALAGDGYRSLPLFGPGGCGAPGQPFSPGSCQVAAEGRIRPGPPWRRPDGPAAGSAAGIGLARARDAGPAAPASPTQPSRSRPRRARGAGCGCCRAATPGRRAQRPQGRTSSRPGAPASSSARAVWRQRSRPASAWASRSRSSSSTGFGTPTGKSASRTSSRPSLPRVAASLRHRSSARRPSGSRCRRRAASARGDQRFRVVAHGGALAAGLAASRPATTA